MNKAHKSKKSQRSASQPKMSAVMRIERSYLPSTDNKKIEKVRLVGTGSISSSAIGVLNAVIGLNPSSAPDWGSYSTIYDEFRVMAVRISLVSEQQFSLTALNGLVGVAYDNDDSVALTSIGAVLAYDTAQMMAAVFTHNANGRENYDTLNRFSWSRPTTGVATSVVWIDVASPGSITGSIKFYGTGLTNSISYYQFALEYFCEFRGRR